MSRTADAKLYAGQGIGAPIGFGQHLGVVVVDFQQAFTSGPLAASYPATELHATAEVLRLARRAGAPVFYTVCAYAADLSDAGPFGIKMPGLAACVRGTPACQVDELVAPEAGEPVLEKTQPSGFFGTDLVDRLHAAHVDTIVVCGATTSGCVRATVVDGMSHGFRVVVPIEAVADRSLAAHDQTLFDIGHKYGDVVRVSEVLDVLAGRQQAAPA